MAKKKKKKATRQVARPQTRVPAAPRHTPAEQSFIVIFDDFDGESHLSTLYECCRSLDIPKDHHKRRSLAAGAGKALVVQAAQLTKRDEQIRREPGRAHLYGALGAGHVAVTPEEAAVLGKHRRVVSVARDERRYAQVIKRGPAIRPLGSTDEPVHPNGGREPRHPAGRTDEPVHPAGMAAPGLRTYLDGYRDGVDNLVSQLGRGRGPGRAAAAVVDTTDLTWALRTIGIQHTSRTGPGVKVAVLDTGLDTSHPDFQGRVAPNQQDNFIGGASVADGHGHGTHCCGVVAGSVQPQQEPRYGVAPDCDLFVGKVLDDDGSGWDRDILAGISWAIEQGVRVISLSLGSARGENAPFSAAYERVAERLIARPDGTLLIAAAGNESERPSRIAPVGNPGACPSVMSVAAVDRADEVASFSCGQTDHIGLVNIAGPGVDIRSSVPGGYALMDGTSMATPYVAGVAVLMLEADRGLTPLALWNQLEAWARPMPWPASDVGYGVVRIPR